MMKNIVNQLINFGQVERGQLGVVVQDLDRRLAKALNVADHRGAVIVEVVYGSPADLAGLQAGDVITHINGRRIKSASDVRNKVGAMRIGTRVNIDISRDGRNKNLTAVVGETQKSSRSRLPKRIEPNNNSEPFWDQQ